MRLVAAKKALADDCFGATGTGSRYRITIQHGVAAHHMPRSRNGRAIGSGSLSCRARVSCCRAFLVAEFSHLSATLQYYQYGPSAWTDGMADYNPYGPVLPLSAHPPPPRNPLVAAMATRLRSEGLLSAAYERPVLVCTSHPIHNTPSHTFLGHVLPSLTELSRFPQKRTPHYAPPR